MTEKLTRKDGRLYLPALDAGFTEHKTVIKGKNYREWDPSRSKLAAALIKGAKNIEIGKDASVLYLGAAHGYTPSFISQIAGKIFAVEFAPRVARELVMLAGRLKNITPILADANAPASYYHMLDAVDIVYQDIAQKNQVEIFSKNCRVFLKKGGTGMIAVKARSIDTTAKPARIFADVKRQLEQEFRIQDYRNLEPFQKDHAFFVCRRK